MKQEKILTTERHIRNILEGSLFSFLKVNLHPHEILAQVCDLMIQTAELEERYGRMVAPDHFKIYINPSKYQDFITQFPDYSQYLINALLEFSHTNGLFLVNEPSVVLIQDHQVKIRSLKIEALHRPAAISSTQSLIFSDGDSVMHELPVAAELVTEDQHYSILKSVMSIGRHRSNDIILDDMIVSRHHAQLRWRGEQFVLIDLKSHNGSYVNGQAISECVLQNGDILAIGKTKLIFSCENFQTELSEETRPISEII